MNITKVHTRRKEGGRKEGRRKEKDGTLLILGPRRPALLIGKIWEYLGTIGTYYGHDQGFMLGSGGGGGGRKEGRKEKAATILLPSSSSSCSEYEPLVKSIICLYRPYISEDRLITLIILLICMNY